MLILLVCRCRFNNIFLSLLSVIFAAVCGQVSNASHTWKKQRHRLTFELSSLLLWLFKLVSLCKIFFVNSVVVQHQEAKHWFHRQQTNWILALESSVNITGFSFINKVSIFFYLLASNLYLFILNDVSLCLQKILKEMWYWVLLRCNKN